MKTFAIGDIHGCYKALLQCIERSEINYQEDQLIVLGDVVDGWSYTPECVEELIKFKHLIPVLGNHDEWFMDWTHTKVVNPQWYRQGGAATLLRYEHDEELVKRHMENYFNLTKIYYIDEKRNFAFMHGGFDWHKPLVENDKDYILWDRHMVETAQYWEAGDADNTFSEFNKVFVGHTTTQHSFNWRRKGSLEPALLSNLINLDTGGGWSGKLTIMNIDTLEYWQSDKVTELYPDEFNSRF